MDKYVRSSNCILYANMRIWEWQDKRKKMIQMFLWQSFSSVQMKKAE